MGVPTTYTDKNETGCCPVPDIKNWDKKEINFNKKKFIREYSRSFLYMPLNMSKTLKKLMDKIKESNASVPNNQWMLLSHDLSPWKAEQLASVSKKVDGADNVELTGTFLSQVFEGPYQNAKQWAIDMREYAESKDREVQDLYFFYTTCPKCSKHYGKNYTIGLAKI